MNEAERLKEKIKIKRKSELMYWCFFIVVVTVGLCYIILQSANTYKPDPSLYVKYNLSEDIIPNPVQNMIEKESFVIRKYGVDIKITKLASYDITGKVEGIKDYSSNLFSNFLNFESAKMADYISPRDLAVSWGEIALKKNSGFIEADQYCLNQDRVVYYKYTNDLIKEYGEEYILSHISNNHVVTLNKDLERELLKIKVTDIVRIKGYLIDVSCSNGYRWGPSSMTREDKGLHSCEILLAEDIVIMNR